MKDEIKQKVNKAAFSLSKNPKGNQNILENKEIGNSQKREDK